MSGCMSKEAAITCTCTCMLVQYRGPCSTCVPRVGDGDRIWPRLCLGEGLEQGEARALHSPPQSPLLCPDSGGGVGSVVGGRWMAKAYSLQPLVLTHSAPSFLPGLPLTSIAQPGPSTEWGKEQRPPSIIRACPAQLGFCPPTPSAFLGEPGQARGREAMAWLWGRWGMGLAWPLARAACPAPHSWVRRATLPL